MSLKSSSTTILSEPKAEAPVKTFSHEELLKALYFIHDLFSRPNLPFFLLEDTAESVVENRPLKGECITVGIRDVDFQERPLSIMEAFFVADRIGKDYIRYTYENVPIMVRVMKDEQGIFTNTDYKIYNHESFRVPNPFGTYWESRTQFIM